MLFQCQVDKGNHGTGWVLSGQFRVGSDEVLYQFGRGLVAACSRVMFQMDVAWHGPLPAGPKIIAPNHPSTTDPFLITALVPEPTSILIDDRLFKVPLFGRYLRGAGHVPVVPGRGRAALETAGRLLEAGRNVAIFPEGAISPLTGGFHAPRTGAARLALSTGAPVIPVGIHLDRERIRLVESRYAGISVTGTWYLRGPYAITVGEPMWFEGDAEDHGHVRSVSKRVMQHIVRLAHQGALRARASQPLATGPITRPLEIPGQA